MNGTCPETNPPPTRGAARLALFAVAFGALLLGVQSYRHREPPPVNIVGRSPATVFSTGNRIQQGAELFDRAGLTTVEALMGRAADTGTDLRAHALGLWFRGTLEWKAREMFGQEAERLDASQRAQAEAATQELFREISVDRKSRTLTIAGPALTAAQEVRQWYGFLFRHGNFGSRAASGILENASDDELATLGEYLIWSAWLTKLSQPGELVRTRSEWPYAAIAGNRWMTDAGLALLLSIAALLAAIAQVSSMRLSRSPERKVQS